MLHNLKPNGIVVLIGIIFVMICGLFLSVRSVEAATLSVTPKDQFITVGSSFVVNVVLDSEQEFINVVEAKIWYPPSMLDVADVSTGGSFLTLWPVSPAIDKDAGTITFAGGIPNGSYVVDGRVITITFRAKAIGNAEIKIDSSNSNVYLNDGKGTKAELNAVPATYVIQNPSPFAVAINSPSHPDESTWYQASTLVFQWDVKEDALYSYALSQNVTEEVDDVPESTVGEVTYENLRDGTYYFIIKEKLSGDEWGPVSRRRAMIDQTLPEQLKYYISQDVVPGKYVLVFSAVDLASGIDRYDIQEGNESHQNVASPYILQDQSRKSTIVLKVFDKAGNTIEEAIPAVSGKVSSLWVVVLISGIALLAVGLFVLAFLRKKRHV